ncbi:hypothetical protein BDW_03340 [Bdellovibrio bacteriovorus W]|nr:hypothetical protein BDW_03340 [Bdellovibrio bacteriovorus W]
MSGFWGTDQRYPFIIIQFCKHTPPYSKKKVRQKGSDARRRVPPATQAYSKYAGERTEPDNKADGPFSRTATPEPKVRQKGLSARRRWALAAQACSKHVGARKPADNKAGRPFSRTARSFIFRR